MPMHVESRPTLISITTKDAKLYQEGNGVNVLDIRTQKPLLEITTTKPEVRIDQSKCFEEAGLKGLKAFMNDAISYGQQVLQAGIARIVDDGNAYANIQSGQDPIPDQALYNAYEMFTHEYNYDTIPKSRPSIELVRGTVNYKFNRGQGINSTNASPVRMTYEPWKVEIAVKQYASIQFRYEKDR